MLDKKSPSLLDRFGKLQEYLLYILMLSMAIMVFAQVLLRYVFHAPLMGIEEIMAFPTIWLYFLGGVNASRERSHIVAKVLEIFMKRPLTLYIERTIMSLFSTAIVIWLTYWGYDYFSYSLRSWKLSASLYIPMFIGECSLFICLVLMAFYTVIELIDNFNKMISCTREKGENLPC